MPSIAAAPFEFSLFLMGDRSATYHDMVAQVCEAEALGFHAVWLGERHLANGDLLWPAPTVAAAYLAARTERIRIGIAARVLPFHHPLQVAADTLTLDVLTRGRFDLGLTRGSMDDASHAAFGVSREEAGRRFDEQLRLLRLACSGEPFSFEGEHLRLTAVVPQPGPVQRPHPPLYMVANSPFALDAAADQGLPVFLNGALDHDAIARCVQRYRTRAQAAGGSAPGPAALLLNRFVCVGGTTAEARQAMRGPFLQFLAQRAPDLRAYLLKAYGEQGADFDFLARQVCIVGDAVHCAAALAELRERTGMARVMCTFNLITLDHDRCVESMHRFAREVVPRLNAMAPSCASSSSSSTAPTQ